MSAVEPLERVPVASRIRCRRPRDLRGRRLARAGVVRRRRHGDGGPGTVCDADLVEERERARVTLEGDPHEVAHRGLDLALRALGEPERGERLDVQPLVRLEQLERLERQRRPGPCPVPGSGRTRRRPAAAPSGTTRSPRASGRTRRSGPPRAAGPARRRGASRTSARPGRAPCRRRAARRRGAAGRTAARPRAAPRGSGPRARRGTTRSRRSRAGRAGPSHAWPTRTSVTTSNVRPRASDDGQLRERLEAPAEPRRGAPDALRDRLELAVARA